MVLCLYLSLDGWIDPGAAKALIDLKGNPTPERIAAFKKYYPNDIGMLKTIGLE